MEAWGSTQPSGATGRVPSGRGAGEGLPEGLGILGGAWEGVCAGCEWARGVDGLEVGSELWDRLITMCAVK